MLSDVVQFDLILIALPSVSLLRLLNVFYQLKPLKWRNETIKIDIVLEMTSIAQKVIELWSFKH